MPKKLDAEHKRAWITFLTAHAVTTRKIDRVLSEAGLPTLDIYDVLLALEAAPDMRLRMSELAERVLLSRSGITRLVDRLEKDGLVERHACAADRRALWAQLTPKGLAERERAWPVYEEAICDSFAEKISGEEAKTISAALLRLLEEHPDCILHGMPPENQEPLP